MTDLDRDHLSDLYGLGFTGFDLMVPGANRTYRLRHDADVYYLRLYREAGRPREQIAAELTLLERFPKHPKIDVARPVPTQGGATLVELPFENRPRLACLFREIEGVEIEMTAPRMREFGEALAWLHVSMPMTVDGPVRKIDPVATGKDAQRAIKPIAGGTALSQAIEQRYFSAFEASPYRVLPQGLCHGDAWTGNARVSDGRIGFFDFDDFGHGAFMLDLGTAAWHLREQGDQSDPLIDAMLSGYEVVRTLSREERATLPLFVQLAELRSLTFLAEHCVLNADMWLDVFRRAEKTLRF
ncbi:phosphotransferase [Bradyrhizobium sp. B117]|uniref:phosphotransferase n=1 Tax=Bradyrhizobium sp. B117 TaxID=3140246 RepID=UPI0031833E7C